MNRFASVFLSSFLFAACQYGCSSSNNQAQDQVLAESQEQTDARETSQFISFEDAFKVAKSQNKLVMVDVYTDWCGWCKKMDKAVYPDQAVQAEMSKYFTSTKLNAEAKTVHTFDGKDQSEEEIAAKLQISAYPTVLFFTPDHKVVKIVPGYVAAPDFAKVLKYVGSRAYETQDFEAWKKSQS